MLKSGFARLDITPPLGTCLAGYFHARPADDILDPLYVSAVAFDDGERKAVILSIDNLGINQDILFEIRGSIAEACGTVREAVYITCTHTHLAPGMNQGHNSSDNQPEYAGFLSKKAVDAARLALADLAPSTLSYTRGEAKDVSFLRRYRMKDGSARTNPGFLNPDVAGFIGEVDEMSQLLVIKREGKPEIGIVNFQVHPDTIGGCSVSADYPKFVRDTYEKLIDNSRCMYINGAQGDSNHIDIRLDETKCRRGYERTRYMGRKIAMSVIANYELREEIKGDEISFANKIVSVKYNKGTPEEVEWAKALMAEYEQYGDPMKIPGIVERAAGGSPVQLVAKAKRIYDLSKLGDEKELLISALAIGDVVFGGFPGEPFTEMGRLVKNNSKFTLTIPSCCTNGYEGYYPMMDAYDEAGYEANSARYERGTAEKLANELSDLINTLK